MIEHRHDWFVFFEEDMNYVWNERIIIMLSTLAAIHRNRHNNDMCEKILDLDECVLNRYQEMIQSLKINSEVKKKYAGELHYRYCRVRMNLWI